MVEKEEGGERIGPAFRKSISLPICYTFAFGDQLQGSPIKVVHGVAHINDPRGDPYGTQNVPR